MLIGIQRQDGQTYGQDSDYEELEVQIQMLNSPDGDEEPVPPEDPVQLNEPPSAPVPK